MTFTVDQVLWSTGSPKKEAPKTFRMQFMGWEFKDGDTSKRTKMAVEDQPRIEAGHSYLIAVSWMERTASSGTATTTALLGGLVVLGVW